MWLCSLVSLSPVDLIIRPAGKSLEGKRNISASLTQPRLKLPTQLSTESVRFVYVPELGGSPDLSLLLKRPPKYGSFVLSMKVKLSPEELFIHILKYINYFSVYQTDVTEVTNCHFAIGD